MDNLKQELPLSLQQALKGQLTSGESIVISLPGSFGEGFAVSDRRAFVIRECESGLSSDCNVFSYPLAKVTGAQAVTATSGGFIELALSDPLPDPEQARVYFPSYELNKFKSAADYLAGAKDSAPEMSVETPSAGVAMVTTEGTCPKCGAAMEKNAAFCGQCGVRVRVICAECSSASPVGSRFCVNCGRPMQEFSAECARCGARVLRWMGYCPECGSVQRQSCIACGAQVVDSWKYCVGCGRLLGSNRLDPQAARAAQSRLQALHDADEERSQQTESAPVESVTSAPATTAEDFNKRGLEFFEAGDNSGAIREFRAAVQMEPQNPSYRCNLAVALDEDDQDEAAFEEYTRTLELDPKDLTALLSLGYLYSENSDQENARSAWNKVIQISPDGAEAQEARENLRHLDQL
ncbi:MAG: zinc ribbon domain-containing protein [Armatimonadota bacterium]|nr:zinc ribbon domain-containing protein [bacterium]